MTTNQSPSRIAHRALLIVFVFAVTLAHAARLNAPAPKFVLKDSSQLKHELSNYKGKVVFINFWASWCAPCRMELPELNRLAADYKGRKVNVLAINVDHDRAAAKALIAKLGLKLPAFSILWDPQSKAVSAYNIESMPSSFILDANGLIRFAHVGFHSPDPQAWRQEIDSLLTRRS